MSDTSTNLQSFISEVKNKGLMKSTHFSVLIKAPTDISGKVIIDDESARPAALNTYVMFCDSVSLPGTSLSTVDVSPYGEIREQPTQRIYDPVSLTFYVDKEFKIKKLFDLWLNYIINPITRNHSYYNDYITEVEITAYDSEHNERYKVTLHECYPKSVGNIAMSYSTEGIMKLDVTMQYRYYTIFDPKKNAKIETDNGSTIKTVLSSGTPPSLSQLTKKVAQQQTIFDLMQEQKPQSLAQTIVDTLL